MDSFRRLISSAFFKAAGHMRPPFRAFVSSKIVPAATGAAVFGMGCIMGSPDLRNKMLPVGKSAILVPLSLDRNTHSKDNRADATTSIEYKTGVDFTAFGAQLAKLAVEEQEKLRQLWEEHSKTPSPNFEFEGQRTLLRFRSLYSAAWALRLIDIADYPEVYQLLEQYASGTNLTFGETVAALQKAQGAIISGEIETLKSHIHNSLEKRRQNGLLQASAASEPVSELERFMGQMPTGSAVLTRLRLLQEIAAQNTDASRLFLDDTMYRLWWVLEHNIRQFARN